MSASVITMLPPVALATRLAQGKRVRGMLVRS